MGPILVLQPAALQRWHWQHGFGWMCQLSCFPFRQITTTSRSAQLSLSSVRLIIKRILQEKTANVTSKVVLAIATYATLYVFFSNDLGHHTAAIMKFSRVYSAFPLLFYCLRAVFFCHLQFFLSFFGLSVLLVDWRAHVFFCGKSGPQKVLFTTYMYWRCFRLVCFQCVSLQEVQNLNPGSFLRKIWGPPTNPRSWEAAEIFGRLAKHLPFLWEMAEENELRFGTRTQRWGTACMCVIYVYIYF